MITNIIKYQILKLTSWIQTALVGRRHSGQSKGSQSGQRVLSNATHL